MAPVHGENGTYVSVFFLLCSGGSSYIYTCYPHTQTTNKQNEKREKLDSMVHCAPSGWWCNFVTGKRVDALLCAHTHPPTICDIYS
jgi:hypothetical protein